ncbi:MAG TPA: TIM barrel protein [Bacteroidales bacterium]|nr:TIM barrel protein [Bacteroidales bacterium]
MKKKTILFKLFALFCGSLLFISLMNSCTEKKKDDKYIGLQLWSVRDHMKTDPDTTIAKVGDIGYGFIEAAGYNDGKFYGMEPADFTALVKENGMDFLSSHAGQALPDSGNRDNIMKWWDDCIAAHKAAGVKYIVQPFMGGDAYENLDVLKNYCDYFNAVGEKCNEAGIRFGYHNHDKEFRQIDGQTIYDYMLQNTDPGKVMFQMDLYWVVEGGADPVAYFDKYPGRFEMWHVKDKAELGASGKMDFKRIFDNKAESGVKYYVVEVEEYNYDPIESVKKSFDFLENADYVK